MVPPRGNWHRARMTSENLGQAGHRQTFDIPPHDNVAARQLSRLRTNKMTLWVSNKRNYEFPYINVCSCFLFGPPYTFIQQCPYSGQLQPSLLVTYWIQHRPDDLQYWPLAEYDVPEVLENTPAVLVVHFGLHQPFPVQQIVLDWPGHDLVSGNCELSTTRRRNNLWTRLRGEEKLPDRTHVSLVHEILWRVLSERLDLSGTARSEGASKIGKASLLDVFGSKRLESNHVATRWHSVGVPELVLMAVDKSHRGREVSIIFDDVREIRHGLLP